MWPQEENSQQFVICIRRHELYSLQFHNTEKISNEFKTSTQIYIVYAIAYNFTVHSL